MSNEEENDPKFWREMERRARGARVTLESYVAKLPAVERKGGPPLRERARLVVSHAVAAGRNLWWRVTGRRAAFVEGWDAAIDNAAMKAYDMGHPEVREQINTLSQRRNP